MDKQKKVIAGIVVSSLLLLGSMWVNLFLEGQQLKSDILTSTGSNLSTVPIGFNLVANSEFNGAGFWTGSVDALSIQTREGNQYMQLSRGTSALTAGWVAQDFLSPGRQTDLSISAKIRAVPTYVPVNFLSNPSFESMDGGRPASWTACSLTGVQTVSGGAAEGARSVSTDCMEQAFTLGIKRGEAYQAHVQIRNSSGAVLPEATLQFAIKNTQDEVVQITNAYTTTPLSSTSGWTTLTTERLMVPTDLTGAKVVLRLYSKKAPVLVDDIHVEKVQVPDEQVVLSLWDVGGGSARLLASKQLSTGDISKGLSDWTEVLQLLDAIPVTFLQTRLQIKFETVAENFVFAIDSVQVAEKQPVPEVDILMNGALREDSGKEYGVGGGDKIANNRIPDGWSLCSGQSSSFGQEKIGSATGVLLRSQNIVQSYFGGPCIEQYVNAVPEMGTEYVATALVKSASGASLDAALWIRHNPGTYLLEEQATKKKIGDMWIRLVTPRLEIRKADLGTLDGITDEQKIKKFGIALALLTQNSALQIGEVQIISCKMRPTFSGCIGSTTNVVTNTSSNANANQNSSATTNLNGNQNQINTNVVVQTNLNQNLNSSANLNQNENSNVNENGNQNINQQEPTTFTPESLGEVTVTSDANVNAIIPKTETEQPRSSAPTLTCPSTCPGEVRRLPDVPDEHFAANAMKYLAQREIMQGDERGRFMPEAFVNRAEFAKLLVRAFLIAPLSGTLSFADVLSSDWFYPYARTLTAKGVIQGYLDGKIFAPKRSINRAEASKMLSLASGQSDAALDTLLASFRAKHPTYYYVYFPDVPINAWFAKYVLYLAENSYIGGRDFDGTKIFSPQGKLTRGEAALLLARIIFDKKIRYPVVKEAEGLYTVQFPQ